MTMNEERAAELQAPVNLGVMEDLWINTYYTLKLIEGMVKEKNWTVGFCGSPSRKALLF